MSAQRRNSLSEIMSLAWQMVKGNGYTMSEALKTAWANIKLRAKMQNGVVMFYYLKIDGTLRKAFGTLKEELIPLTKGSERQRNDTVQVYYDYEKSAFRSFKKANLMNVINL